MARMINVVFLVFLGIIVGCSQYREPPLKINGVPFRLPGTNSADLDELRLMPESGADVFWKMITDEERYWVPLNGARYAVMGNRKPEYRDCLVAKLSQEPIDASVGTRNRLTDGTFLCGRTDRGQTVIVEVVRYGYHLDLRVWVYGAQ